MFQGPTDVINAMQTNSGVGIAVTELNTAYSHITAQRVFFGNAMNQLQSQSKLFELRKSGTPPLPTREPMSVLLIVSPSF